jgi:hypothetical protein
VITLKKFWHRDDKKWSIEIIIKSLSDYFDNIIYNDKYSYWIAFQSPRSEIMEKLF